MYEGRSLDEMRDSIIDVVRKAPATASLVLVICEKETKAPPTIRVMSDIVADNPEGWKLVDIMLRWARNIVAVFH